MQLCCHGNPRAAAEGVSRHHHSILKRGLFTPTFVPGVGPQSCYQALRREPVWPSRVVPTSARALRLRPLPRFSCGCLLCVVWDRQREEAWPPRSRSTPLLAGDTSVKGRVKRIRAGEPEGEGVGVHTD